MAPASSPEVERQIRVASGSRPAVIATMPAGSRVSAAVTACRSRPPRSPRRSRTMPSGGRGPAKPCSIACARWPSVPRLKAVTWITSDSLTRCTKTVSGGTTARSMSAECRRPSRPRQATEQWVSSGPAIQFATVAGSLPWADWPSTDTIVSPGRIPASAPGPSAMASTTTMAAPRRTRRRPAPA